MRGIIALRSGSRVLCLHSHHSRTRAESARPREHRLPEVLLPLFPLEVVLLPEELLPLHIFEDRYKEMIGECLAAKSLGSPGQEFGVVLAKKGEMEAVGCCARIVNVTRKYRDGRMDILTVGTRRFEVVLTNDEKPYLRGEVEFFEDETGAEVAEDPDAQRAIDLFRSAMQKFHRAADMPIQLPRPYRYLSFRIAAPLPLELGFKQRLLSILNETERLRQVVRVIEQLIAQLELVEKAKAKAGGNGNVLRENR